MSLNQKMFWFTFIFLWILCYSVKPPVFIDHGYCKSPDLIIDEREENSRPNRNYSESSTSEDDVTSNIELLPQDYPAGDVSPITLVSFDRAQLLSQENYQLDLNFPSTSTAFNEGSLFENVPPKSTQQGSQKIILKNL